MCTENYIKIEIILEFGVGVKNKGKEKGMTYERNKKEKAHKRK
jgi:hypothetical protein